MDSVSREKNLKNIFKMISICILLFFSGSVLAGSWIIGYSMAVTTGSNNDGLLNSQLADSGLNAEADTEDNFRIIWQLYGGYDFAERWGVELGYLDMDMVKTTFTGTAADIDAFLSSAQDIHPQTAQGWLLSMVHYFPINSQNRVKVRIGMYDWVADYTMQGGSITKSISQDGFDLSYGVGLEMGSWHRESAIGHIKWDNYTVDKTEFRVLSVGFSYKFE
jgi:large repetitive protein